MPRFLAVEKGKEQEKQKVSVRLFIAAVRKYTDMQQPDASVLREFVDRIYISEVYTPDENKPRIKVRENEIVYNFIGAFDFEGAFPSSPKRKPAQPKLRRFSHINVFLRHRPTEPGGLF